MNRTVNQALTFITRRMADDGKWAAIDQAVISLSNFAASILLARLVSPTELGVYVTGFLAIYFIRAIQNGLIIQPLNTIGAVSSMDEFKPYFSAAAIQQLVLASFSSVGALLLGWILTQFGNDTLGPAVFTLWFSFFTWQLQEFFRRVFYTRGSVVKTVWISVSANLIRIGLILILSLYQPISGLTGLNAIGWGSLVATLLGAWLARDYFTKKINRLLVTWLENWRFGRWILGASMAEWVVVDLYPIMMAGLVSFAAAGAYQSLQNLVAPIHVLLRAMDTFATPIAAKAFHESGLPKLTDILKKIYIFSGIPVFGLLILDLIFTPYLLYLLKGDTYLPFANGIYVMAVFYIFLFINRPLQMAFRAINKGKQVFIANILAALSMFTLGFGLISRWGLYGAIGGQALNAFIISLVLFIAWRKNARHIEKRTGVELNRES
ncbi:MAG: lipopolysaccharide biosynthesis protein [Anaerolineales bacterium]